MWGDFQAGFQLRGIVLANSLFIRVFWEIPCLEKKKKKSHPAIWPLPLRGEDQKDLPLLCTTLSHLVREPRGGLGNNLHSLFT